MLDYGLAKAIEGDRAETSDSELPQSPTLTRQGTAVGVILGTAAYMSPEQAKGRWVAKRADGWAFAAVVYEMLTGQCAFAGEDVSETQGSVRDVGVPDRAIAVGSRRLRWFAAVVCRHQGSDQHQYLGSQLG